jgi:hypothetical protein
MLNNNTRQQNALAITRKLKDLNPDMNKEQ